MKNLIDEKNNLLESVIIGGLVVFVGCVYVLVNNDKNKLDKDLKEKDLNEEIEPEYYKKFYKILVKESGLDKDPYRRKLDKNTVKIFCQIAKKNNINISDSVDKDTFDILYKQLVQYQIQINLNK